MRIRDGKNSNPGKTSQIRNTVRNFDLQTKDLE
jgi:hypothetical protein